MGTKRRSGNKRPQKNLIIIVSQGKQTEPKYFNHYIKKESSFVLKTEPTNGLDPVSLVKHAKYLKEEFYVLGPRDKIYSVYDVDRFPERQLKQAQELAGETNMKTCVSNPCFEIWYLLHYKYSTSSLNSYDDVKRELLRYISDYDKDKDVFSELRQYQAKAISHAKRLDEHHKREEISSICGCNPSTQIYQLIEYLNKLV